MPAYRSGVLVLTAFCIKAAQINVTSFGMHRLMLGLFDYTFSFKTAGRCRTKPSAMPARSCRSDLDGPPRRRGPMYSRARNCCATDDEALQVTPQHLYCRNIWFCDSHRPCIRFMSATTVVNRLHRTPAPDHVTPCEDKAALRTRFRGLCCGEECSTAGTTWIGL